MKTIGDQIKEARKLAKPQGEEIKARELRIIGPGITQQELAARGCGSLGHIAKCEVGKADPSREFLGAIAAATGYVFHPSPIGGASSTKES